ncbi:MAG: replicative DNA helicase [Bryobacter sp.]
MNDPAFQKGLPSNLEAERLVLGAILLDPDSFVLVGGDLKSEDFTLEAHRRIFERMGAIHARGEKIDRVGLADELMRHSELESVGGLSYLMSLDEGIPQIVNVHGYVRIIREKSTLRRIIFTAQSIMDKAFLGVEEADHLLGEAEESFLRIGESRAHGTLQRPDQIINSIGFDEFLDPSNRIQGVSTGFYKFDEMTGGFRPGELIIIAARPAMGKTAFALNIASHVVGPALGRTTAVFSLEMSKESLLTRMVCAAARVDQHRFRTGFLNEDERRQLSFATTNLMESPLYLDDAPGVNVMDIHAKLRRIQAERGLGLVIVDYLQLMQSRGNHDSRTQEVSSISRGLKLLSKELEVPIIALSQLSRAPETRPGDHRPQLSDLRESGSIEQDADMVCFLFREEVYKPDRDDLKGHAELIIAKQRNGPTGRVPLAFLHKFTQFQNLAEDVEPPPDMV